MLRHLQVRNLVVVESLSLELEEGMTALTGETGAGKSILVDALALALGGPGDRGMIREGADQAEVTALFDVADLPAARAWLQEQALDEEDDCILRRVLARGGRSRAFVNGRPVPLKRLAELGGLLVEIHGQHEHQRLLRPSVQRELLDAWAGHDELVAAVRRAHRRWRDAGRALETLRAETDEREKRLDYLEFQLAELEPVVREVADLEQLEREQKRLAGAETLLQGADRLLRLLEADESSAQPLLAAALRESTALAGEAAPELAPVAELLESARIQVEEAAAAVRDFAAGIEPDPERLAAVESRLGAVHDLARKHRVAPRDLPALHRELAAERDRLADADASLAALEAEAEAARARYLEACRALGRSRRQAAVRLAERLTGQMQGLAMEGGRFEIAVEPLDEEAGGPAGLERVEFRVATNPGQAPAPLARVASGGELSRLSLAIQVAVTADGDLAALVFDEVDTGIGGGVAETVGALLRRLGERRQVFCVTHLPQVAAQAHHHLRVRKRRLKSGVRTEVEVLEGEERIREIARMSGGRRITPQALEHARALVAGDHSEGRLGQSGSRHSP